MGSMSNMAPAQYSVYRNPEPSYHLSDLQSGQKHKQQNHNSSYPHTYVLPPPASSSVDGRIAVSGASTALPATTPAAQDRFFTNRRSGSISGSSYRSHQPLHSSLNQQNDGNLHQHNHVGIHYSPDTNNGHHPTLPTLQQSQSAHFPGMMAQSASHSPEIAQSQHIGYAPGYLNSQQHYESGSSFAMGYGLHQHQPQQPPSHLYPTATNSIAYDSYNRSNGTGQTASTLAAAPTMNGSAGASNGLNGSLNGESSVRILNSRPKPQCWEHGCNGRQFSTFSNLLRHQREKSGAAAKSLCPRCGANFTRTTARNGHVDNEKCKPRRMTDGE